MPSRPRGPGCTETVAWSWASSASRASASWVSPVRSVVAMRTGRLSSRLSRKASARTEPLSHHWTSSTASTTGRSAARLTVSQYRPCSTAKDPSARSAGPAVSGTSPKTDTAEAAAPESSSSRRARSVSRPSKSWRTAPNPNSRSSWLPLAASTRAPRSAPSRRTSCSSRLLPMPAGPWIRASRPCPARASSRAAPSTRTSRSRSTISSGAATTWVARPATSAGYGDRRWVGADRPVQARRLGEDLGLQRAQGRPGVDAELVGERAAGLAEGGEGVGLAVGPVEREHEQPPALLTQGVGGDQRLDLGHEDRRFAAAQPGLDQLLPRDVAQARQPCALGVGPRVPEVVGERRAPPQAQARARARRERPAGTRRSRPASAGARRTRRRPRRRRPAARSPGPAGRGRCPGRAGPGRAPAGGAGGRRRPAGRWSRWGASERPTARRSAGRPARRRPGPRRAGRAPPAAAGHRGRRARRCGSRSCRRGRRCRRRSPGLVGGRARRRLREPQRHAPRAHLCRCHLASLCAACTIEPGERIANRSFAGVDGLGRPGTRPYAPCVSNLERRPEETATGGLATVSHEPVRRVLAAREVPLGGPRGMVVRRTLPHRELRTVGAWCFCDDYGPSDPAEQPMVVPPHPHTGLQTVTWLLSGEALHQDSLGSEQVVRPGALNLMTAGRGIAHAETSTPASPEPAGCAAVGGAPGARPRRRPRASSTTPSCPLSPRAGSRPPSCSAGSATSPRPQRPTPRSSART